MYICPENMNIYEKWASLMAQIVKNLSALQEMQVQSLSKEDSLEEGMATHSSVLARRIPWTEEPGGLQSMGSQRVRHNWVTNTHTHTHTHMKSKMCVLSMDASCALRLYILPSSKSRILYTCTQLLQKYRHLTTSTHTSIFTLMIAK